MQRPTLDECAPFYQGYLARVPDGDLATILLTQGEATAALLDGIAEARGDFAYAPGKWSIKRLVQHVVDGERLFCYRLLCIARGETQSLPGFDENAYAERDGSERRTLRAIVAEFRAVRAATLALLDGLPPEVGTNRGIANGKPVSARAIAWMIAGHELHHRDVLRERYSVG
ncbi:MAG: hypothetical protein RL398_817 [Planctomycetota bacterium]|jgi:uncharacterized damage-inducible protein DinB